MDLLPPQIHWTWRDGVFCGYYENSVGEKQDTGLEINFDDRTGMYSASARRYSTDAPEPLQMQSSTNLEEMKALVDEDSRYDVLTHVYSRSYFLHYLDHMVQKAKENKSILSLLLIYIDNFRYMNNYIGRTATDDVLVKIASLIQDCSRPSDMLGRVGGDEFMVVLPETTRNKAEAIAEQMKASVKSHPFHNRSITITAVVCCSDEIEMYDARKLLMESGLQLEIAKNIRDMSGS